MKIETYLNAMEEAQKRYWLYPTSHKAKARIRQGLALRARILRMYAEKDELEELRTEQWKEIMRQAKRIAEKDDEIGDISHYFDCVFEQLEDCRKEVIEKDEEIRVLEKYIKDHDYKTILDYMEKYLEGDIE